MNPIRPQLRTAILLASLVSIAGCSVVTANNKDLQAAHRQFGSGNGTAALAELRDRNDLPGILDRAVYLSAMGEPAKSNAEFDVALGKIREFENRATVSGREVGRGAGSILVNDKLLEYQGEGYEKVLIHTYKARNYVLLGDVEAARVEIRNADMRQADERKRNQDLIEEARSESKEGNVDFAALNGKVDQTFSGSKSILSRLDNVYQNPFAFYLSGVVYEANGEMDDAFIDYKKAYEMVHSPLIATDLVRAAKKAGRMDEVDASAVAAASSADKPGSTLVFVDAGSVPQREEFKFPIPTYKNVLFAAVPLTKPMPNDFSGAEVLGADGTVIGRTDMLVDVEAMAVRNLHDQYPAILVRQAVRLAAKGAAEEVGRQALEDGLRDSANPNDPTAALAGLLFGLAASTVNAVTEQADLRGWYALPNGMHVARVQLPDDATSVKVRMNGGSAREVEVPLVKVGPNLKVAAVRHVNGQTMISTPKQATVQMAAAAVN